MATTITALVVKGVIATLGHVGDSRCYLKRKERVHQLTCDHTYVGELLARGEISLAESLQSPFAHVLTRCLGQEETVAVELTQFDIFPHDTFLLVTDGLLSVCRDHHELFDLLSEIPGAKLPEHLLSLMNERDGSDNGTVVVVSYTDFLDAAEVERTRAEEVSLQLSTLQQMELFQELSLAELLRIMELVVVEKYDIGHTIVREGQQGDALMILVEGLVEVTVGGTRISELSQGAHFGEMALLENRPRTASVKTMAPTMLLRLESQAFLELAQQMPDLGVKLYAALARVLAFRLDEANRQASGGI